MKDFDLARPAACQRTSNGRRRPCRRRIAYTLTSNPFTATPPIAMRILCGPAQPLRSASADGTAAEPYSRFAVWGKALDQGATSLTPTWCLRRSGWACVLHCGYERGHAPG